MDGDSNVIVVPFLYRTEFKRLKVPYSPVAKSEIVRQSRAIHFDAIRALRCLQKDSEIAIVVTLSARLGTT